MSRAWKDPLWVLGCSEPHVIQDEGAWGISAKSGENLRGGEGSVVCRGKDLNKKTFSIATQESESVISNG